MLFKYYKDKKKDLFDKNYPNECEVSINSQM